MLLNGSRDAATRIAELLGPRVSFEEHSSGTGVTAVWELFTSLFLRAGRFYQALELAHALYLSMLDAERVHGRRLHKGMPLVYIADAYGGLGYVVHEERYLMLTLCEDAIRGEGVISPNTTGIYFRLVWGLGLSDKQVREYAQEIYAAYQAGAAAYAFFPEALVQDIDPHRRWQLRPPAAGEMSLFKVNAAYVEFLLDHLGDKSGQTLERLAEYLLSCMAGCRPRRSVSSLVSQYDVMCSMNGNYFDCRSEFGRYFVCECKDWKSRAGIAVIAKFVGFSIRRRRGLASCLVREGSAAWKTQNLRHGNSKRFSRIAVW